MSGDIVEQLRNVFPIGWEGEMRHKAADEIERLRRANEGLLALVDVTRDAATGHQERAEMLRTALRDLLKVMPVFPAAAREIVGMEDRYNDAIRNARNALTEAGYG